MIGTQVLDRPLALGVGIALAVSSLHSMRGGLHNRASFFRQMGSQQIEFPGAGDSLGAVADTQLAIDVVDVGFDRALGEVKL